VGAERGRKLAWIAGWAAVLLLALPPTLQKGSEAHNIVAYYLGGVLFGVAVGWVLYAAFVKLSRSGGRLWSPWVLVIASGALLMATLGRSQQHSDASAQLECSGPPPASYFAGLPKRFVAVQDPDGEAEFRQVMREVGANPEIAARAIRLRGEFVAEALVLDVGESRDEIARGFREEATRHATEPPRSIPVGDGQGTLVKATLQGVDIVYVWGFTGCSGVVVFGNKVEESREVADALARSGG
jgi:hypothetical protein